METVMARVMIECPKTGRAIYTGLNLSWTTFESYEIGESRIKCAHCGEIHVWTRSDAMLDEAGGEA